MFYLWEGAAKFSSCCWVGSELLWGQVVICSLHKRLNIFTVPNLPPSAAFPTLQAHTETCPWVTVGVGTFREIAVCGSQLERCPAGSVSAVHPWYGPAFSTGHLWWWGSCWCWRSDKRIFPPVVKRTAQPHLWHVHLLSRVKPAVVFRHGKPLPPVGVVEVIWCIWITRTLEANCGKDLLFLSFSAHNSVALFSVSTN